MTFLIVLLFGGVALWCLLVTPVKRWRFERHAAEAVWASARVVSTDSETAPTYGDNDRNAMTTHYADLEFTTEDGRLFGIRREVREGLEPGAQVPVAYRTDSPNEARLDWSSDPWAGSSWPGVLGFVTFAGIGIAILWGNGSIDLG